VGGFILHSNKEKDQYKILWQYNILLPSLSCAAGREGKVNEQVKLKRKFIGGKK